MEEGGVEGGMVGSQRMEIATESGSSSARERERERERDMKHVRAQAFDFLKILAR